MLSMVAPKFLVNVPYKYVLGTNAPGAADFSIKPCIFKSSSVFTVGLPGAEYVVFTLPENS